MQYFYKILRGSARPSPHQSTSLESPVYGPFDDDSEAKEHFHNLGQDGRCALLFQAEVIESDRADHEKREPSCDESNFEERDGKWYCRECDTVARGATVYHPVWEARLRDQGVDGVGHGEVRTEQVPYCPRCEKKPSSNGTPIYE